MDISNFLAVHWNWISGAPVAFIVWTLMVAAATIAGTRTMMGDALEAARERAQGALEEASRLRGDKSQLLERLEQYGDDIQKIQADLAARGRIHVSDRPPGPEDSPSGPNDLWVTTKSK